MIRFSLAVWWICAAALPAGALAQEPQAVSDSGTTIERVASAADSSQWYAMYLPPDYDPSGCWPVFIVMDPRGRAMVPMRLLRPAAAQYGYLIVSSYNTMSDGAGEPNVPAVNAILADVEDLTSVDCSRLYLVGFSGTARVAWEFAYQLAEHMPAIIGFGAGLPWGLLSFRTLASQRGTPFGFYGGTGLIDFNYEEVRTLDRELDAVGVRHRIEFYPGPHQWPPAEQFTRAVEWIELDAIRRGLKADSTGWVSDLYRRRLSAARAAALAGSPFRALRLYRALGEDFGGLHDLAGVSEIVDSLSMLPDVTGTERRLDDLAQQHERYRYRLGDFIQTVELSDRPMTVTQSKSRLQIERLQQRSQSPTDTLDKLAAMRMLETAFVHTAFYEPRAYFEKNDFQRALVMLEVAHTIRPDDASVCYGLARAYAGLGRTAEAVSALECMAAVTSIDPDRLERDPHVAPLRNDASFRELISRLRAGGTAERR